MISPGGMYDRMNQSINRSRYNAGFILFLSTVMRRVRLRKDLMKNHHSAIDTENAVSIVALLVGRFDLVGCSLDMSDDAARMIPKSSELLR